ncbi:hypothetical protein TMatcc_006661 [Talaromyces marneffei ATCC 18224]
MYTELAASSRVMADPQAHMRTSPFWFTHGGSYISVLSLYLILIGASLAVCRTSRSGLYV